MKLIQLSLFLIVSISISGCTPKTIVETKYIKQTPYEFQEIDLSSAYIEISQEEQICIPKLKELNTIYKDVKAFYDNQIIDYKSTSK